MYRWWPALGTLGTIALGLAVGTGSTAVDDRFLRDAHGIFGADPSWMFPVLAAVVVIALVRRAWHLALVAATFTGFRC